MEVITSGYTRKCKDSLGGLENVYLFTFKKYARSQIVVNGNLLVKFPPTTIYPFAYIGSPNFINKGNESDGGYYYDEDLKIKLPIVNDNFNISKLLKKDLRCIIKDRNGKYRILGLYNGLECESVNANIGTSKNSFNGYEITLKGQEIKEALYIENLQDANFVFEGEETFYRITQSGDLRIIENNDKRITQNG